MRYILGIIVLCGIGWFIQKIYFGVSKKITNLEYQLTNAYSEIDELTEENKQLKEDIAKLEKRKEMDKKVIHALNSIIKKSS